MATFESDENTHTALVSVVNSESKIFFLFTRTRSKNSNRPWWRALQWVLWSEQEDRNIDWCKSHWHLLHTASIRERAERWICHSIRQKGINTCRTAVSKNWTRGSCCQLGARTFQPICIWQFCCRGNRPQATARVLITRYPSHLSDSDDMRSVLTHTRLPGKSRAQR